MSVVPRLQPGFALQQDFVICQVQKWPALNPEEQSERLKRATRVAMSVTPPDRRPVTHTQTETRKPLSILAHVILPGIDPLGRLICKTRRRVRAGFVFGSFAGFDVCQAPRSGQRPYTHEAN